MFESATAHFDLARCRHLTSDIESLDTVMCKNKFRLKWHVHIWGKGARTCPRCSLVLPAGGKDAKIFEQLTEGFSKCLKELQEMRPRAELSHGAMQYLLFWLRCLLVEWWHVVVQHLESL